MSSNSRNLDKFRVNVSSSPSSKWELRRDIPLAILAWLGLGAIVLWAADHVIRSILILTIAAFLAFALAPAVKFLERAMPRFLAILIVYLFVLSGICLLLYLIIATTVQQIDSLTQNLKILLTPGTKGQVSPLIATLERFGISQSQINGVGQQVISQAEGIAGGAIPLLTSIFDFILDTIIVAVLSIYLLVDGSRVGRWLRTNTPMIQRDRANFLLDTLERIVGGYIRGQLTLSLLIGVLVGVGMMIFGVPYAVLLGVLAFVLEFIPVLGTLVSGAVCVLIAFTKGWLIAILVLAYFVIVHIIEGDVVGPRIVGKAIGLHPVVSLIALIAGAELFGIAGALFASPVAGVVQALLVSFWVEWRNSHPDQFPMEDAASHAENAADSIGEKAAVVGEVLTSSEGRDSGTKKISSNKDDTLP